MNHARLGGDDEGVGGLAPAPVDHQLGGADHVRHLADGLGALGVGDDGRARMGGLGPEQGARRELHVGVAVAWPELHRPAGLARDPASEVLVRHEEDAAVGGDLAHDLAGVAAGHDDVRRVCEKRGRSLRQAGLCDEFLGQRA